MLNGFINMASRYEIRKLVGIDCNRQVVIRNFANQTACQLFFSQFELSRSPVGSSTVSTAPPRALGRQRRDDVLRYDNHNADTID